MTHKLKQKQRIINESQIEMSHKIKKGIGQKEDLTFKNYLNYFLIYFKQIALLSKTLFSNISTNHSLLKNMGSSSNNGS